jgi:predicted DCC family thiol-disulfide oxidoreductase YuxK
METPAPIVFYDGDCGLCNRTVRYILKKRKSGFPIYFAALQSDFTRTFFAERNEPKPDLSTVAVFTGTTFLYRSDAALFLTKSLRNHGWLRGFVIIPGFVRDWFYAIIARYRKQLTSKEFCVMPNSDELGLFLDR